MKDGELTHAVIEAAIEIHRNLGPGLLEAVYEECLARELTLLSIPYERQKAIPLVYREAGVRVSPRPPDCWSRCRRDQIDRVFGGDP